MGWFGRDVGGLEVGVAVVVGYVAGHPADGIQMYAHPRDSTPVPRGARIGQLGVPDARNRLRIRALYGGQTPGRPGLPEAGIICCTPPRPRLLPREGGGWT